MYYQCEGCNKLYKSKGHYYNHLEQCTKLKLKTFKNKHQTLNNERLALFNLKRKVDNDNKEYLEEIRQLKLEKEAQLHNIEYLQKINDELLKRDTVTYQINNYIYNQTFIHFGNNLIAPIINNDFERFFITGDNVNNFLDHIVNIIKQSNISEQDKNKIEDLIDHNPTNRDEKLFNDDLFRLIANKSQELCNKYTQHYPTKQSKIEEINNNIQQELIEFRSYQ